MNAANAAKKKKPGDGGAAKNVADDAETGGKEKGKRGGNGNGNGARKRRGNGNAAAPKSGRMKSKADVHDEVLGVR